VNLTASAANGSDCGRRHRNLIKTPYLDCSLSHSLACSLGVIVSKHPINARGSIGADCCFALHNFFAERVVGAAAARAGIIASSLSAVTTSSVTNTVLRNAASLFGMIPIYITYVGLRILVGQLFFSEDIHRPSSCLARSGLCRFLSGWNSNIE